MSDPIYSVLSGKGGACGSACQQWWCCYTGIYGWNSLSDCVTNGPGVAFDPEADANAICSRGVVGVYNPETPWLTPCDSEC
jgi:hypothetical protein